MSAFTIYYAKNPEMYLFSMITGVLPKIDIRQIENTHVLLKKIITDDLEHVFFNMQGENWSPKGEGKPIIQALGLKHTSMTIGDVVKVDKTNTFFRCSGSGWEYLGKLA